MGTVYQTLRYESKMTTDIHKLSDVLVLLKTHSSMFYRHFPSRIVNNIYFDSPSYISYYNHVAGAANREKLRLRWYGMPENIISYPVLERKIKYGMVGEKISEKLNSLPLDKHSPWPLPKKAITNHCQLTDAIHWRLLSVVPVLALRYERHYFLSSDQKFRITVDTDLEYFGLTQNGKAINKSVRPAPIIIEVKYSQKYAEEATMISNELPFRVSCFSKYIHAVEGLNFSMNSVDY